MVTSVHMDDFTADVQPETGATAALQFAGVELNEFSKDFSRIFGRNSLKNLVYYYCGISCAIRARY